MILPDGSGGFGSDGDYAIRAYDTEQLSTAVVIHRMTSQVSTLRHRPLLHPFQSDTSPCGLTLIYRRARGLQGTFRRDLVHAMEPQQPTEGRFAPLILIDSRGMQTIEATARAKVI